jgi:hypothetical protein
MPIIAYNAVQTGPNNHPGGVHAGFARVAYQVGMAGVVASAPRAPTSSHDTIATA